jgi:hypothetical protein
MAGRQKYVDEVITMKVENNLFERLMMANQFIVLFPIAKDTIVSTDYNIKGFFIRDANGKIISATKCLSKNVRCPNEC